ncbi:PucR family transcriptional regulator [Actinomadura craniellae]|uniref:PucR family transcriptional regulator n=1 Tax=Actinomadura craniellae TaxID=2231787 RepID=A0A365GZJ1_9ACTN|nr:helix-turn-helix domain-containing protein [Actinomadura craniellae]RAY12188.1 PucR family transcriptional regulator [Actinomadura craniellae]
MSDAEVAAVIAVMRGRAPAVVAEAVQAIEAQLPVIVRPHDPRYAQHLNRSVSLMIGEFIELMEDDEHPLDRLLDFFRGFGAWTTEEGIRPEEWQTAFSIGTGITISRLSEAVQDHPGVTPNVIGQIAQKTLVYVDQVTAAMLAGHKDTQARAAGEQHLRRRKLLDLLISESPSPDEVRELALDAAWRIPMTVAAVALHRRDPGVDPARRSAVPADALAGLHLPEPCLIIPDPDGPGRREALAAELGVWTAAIGPTTEITGVARSLAWARRALGLALDGHIRGPEPVVAADHVPLMQAFRDRDMTEYLVAARLAPLMEVRDQYRRRLATTLLSCLESGFNATDVASRLHLHAQTVRYRLRQLEELFGTAMYEPRHHLEFIIALHYWLATNPDDH